MLPGWLDIARASEYTCVSPRTLREWLKSGLPHSRVHGGKILIAREALDEFLGSFAVQSNQTEDIVNEIMREFDGKPERTQ